MTNLKVELIAHTLDPERIVAAAAKLCYSSSDTATLFNGLTLEKTEQFIKKLSDLGHESPFEHISFTFSAEGVSRALTHQLVRHRIASYSQKSQRYVNESGFDYITPPEIEQNTQAKAEYIKAMDNAIQSYTELQKLLTEAHTQKLIQSGVDALTAKKQAEKMAIEDARFVLPNACETKIILTFNARSLFNFFSERCCNRAQWEIRNLATEMYKLVYAVCPNVFANKFAPCVSGKCPEGQMSCGKMVEMKEFHRQLIK